jgi:hypothetical protein
VMAVAGLTRTERRICAVHEAGHAVVAMYCGIDVIELRIGPGGGECTHLGGPQRKRGGKMTRRRRLRCALIALGGYLAASMHCRHLRAYEAWNDWDNLGADWSRFKSHRCGITWRRARTVVLGILREKEQQLLHLASVLERDGFVDSTNYPVVLSENSE